MKESPVGLDAPMLQHLRAMRLADELEKELYRLVRADGDLVVAEPELLPHGAIDGERLDLPERDRRRDMLLLVA
jgi:hypothetical protein